MVQVTIIIVKEIEVSLHMDVLSIVDDMDLVYEDIQVEIVYAICREDIFEKREVEVLDLEVD